MFTVYGGCNNGTFAYVTWDLKRVESMVRVARSCVPKTGQGNKKRGTKTSKLRDIKNSVITKSCFKLRNFIAPAIRISYYTS